MGLNTRADDATLLQATRSGDHSAFEVLVRRWLPRAFDTASFVLADAADVTAAVADGFEHVWRHRDDLQPPASFGSHVVRATRAAATLRAATGAPAADDEDRTTGLFTRDGVTAEERLVAAAKAADAMADADVAAVVRRAAVAVDPVDRSLLLAHVRDGVAAEDLGTDVGIAADAMDQRLFRVRARYRAALEARVLWRSGHPQCADLDRIIGTGPASRFDTETAATVIDHAESCTTCRTAKRLQATPAALLAALPDLPVPDEVGEVTRHRLAVAGFVAPESGATSTWALARLSSGDQPPRRRRVLVACGGAVAVILALLLIGLQPWNSASPKHSVGVLGGASDGSKATGSIQADQSSSAPAKNAKNTPTTVRRTTTTVARAPSTSTAPSVSLLPPVTSPPVSGVHMPVVTSAAATVINPDRCPNGPGEELQVDWSTQDATAVSVSPAAEEQGPFPGSGSARVCVASLPATISLTATGPGGEATQDVMVDAPPPTTTTTVASQAPSTTG